MKIKYKNKGLQKVCEDASVATRKYGKVMAEKIHSRIDQIEAIDTVEELIKFGIGRCHPLSQNRRGQYAMDLENPYRLVFEKEGNTIQIANILEIVDYH